MLGILGSAFLAIRVMGHSLRILLDILIQAILHLRLCLIALAREVGLIYISDRSWD